MKKVIYFFCLLFFCYSSNAQFQGIVLNELSQGPNGSSPLGAMEYIELVVVGNRTCTDSTADLSNWIIDDNNGWLGAATGQGTATGHIRFPNIANWSKVPYGSIILLYNDFPLEKNPKITLANDPTDANKDFVYIVPISSTLLEKNSTEPTSPSSANYSYPAANASGYTTTFVYPWGLIGVMNSNDGIIITAPTPRNSAYFALGFGGILNPSYPTIYKSTAGNVVYYLTDGQPRATSSWQVGDIGPDETPGMPNTSANDAWLLSMRAKPTPDDITVNVSKPAFCPGGSTTLSAQSATAYNYTWTGASVFPTTGALVNANPATSGLIQYTVTGVLGGCTKTTTVSVFVHTPPIITAGAAKDTICLSGTGTALFASGVPANDTSYFWYPSLGLNAVTLPAVLANPTTTTLYSVIGKDANGCTDTATVKLNVINGPAPKDTITGAGTTCPGSSVPWGYPSTIHNANPGNQYSWTGPNGFVSSLRFVNVSAAGIYYLTITNAAGCKTVAQKTLKSEPVTASISGSISLCAQQEIPLEVKFSGGAAGTRYAFTYSVNGGPAIRYPANPAEYSEGPIEFDVFPPNNGINTYTLKSVSSETCGAGLLFAGSDVATVTVGRPETPVITSLQPTCSSPGSFEITSPIGNEYTYSLNGATYQASPKFLTVPQGVYKVTAKNAGDCISLEADVTINNTPPQPAAPTAPASQTFCGSATVADLAASGTDLKWFIVATGGTQLATATPLVNNTTYYVSQTVSGCESPRTAVTVTIGATTPAPTATTPQTFCSGANPTVANLTANGASIKWYSALTGGSALPTNTSLINNTTYYASQTTNCGEGPRAAVQVSVTATPLPPTATTPQTFCSNTNPTIANLTAGGSGLLWYAASTGGSPLATSTALTDNTTYYVSQTTTCGESARTAVNVTVNADPSAPVATSPQSFCSSSNPTVSNLVATGNSIKWYDASTGGSVLAGTFALADNATYYASQTTICGESIRTAVTVNFSASTSAPSAPTPQTFCSGTNPTVASLNANGTNLNWYTTSTGGSPLTASTSLSNGVSYFVSQTTSCGESARTPVDVVINVTPGAPVVTSPQSFCSGNNPVIDSLKPSGAKYKWYDVSAGGTALAGSTKLLSQTYYVSETGTGTCESVRQSVFVVVNATPEVTVKAVPSVCEGSPVTINFKGTPGVRVSFTANGIAGFTDIKSDSTGNVPIGSLYNTITYIITDLSYIPGGGNNSGCKGIAGGTTTVVVTKAPVAPAKQTFCSTNKPTVADIEVNGKNVKWYKTPAGGTPLPSSTILQTGPYYVSSTDESGCETGRIQVDVSVPVTTTPIPQKLFQNFCNANSTVADLEPKGSEYLWYENATGGSVLSASTPLRSGDYYVSRIIITSGVPCESEGRGKITANVSPPLPAPGATKTDATCFTSGSIKVDVVDPNSSYNLSGPNNYSISDPANGLFKDLAPGVYRLSVNTAGCQSAENVFTINGAAGGLSVTANAAPVPCGQSTGSVTVNPSNGTAPYTYSIDGGTTYQTNNTFTGLAAGTYSIKVKDANGCTADVTTTISSSGSAVTATATAAPIPCGQSSGSITINASNGTAPYTYSIDGGTTYQTTNTFIGLAAGTHSIKVKDANGCTADINVTITQSNSTIRANASHTNAGCGQSNGTITMNTIGGTPTYQYSINGGTTFFSTNTFSNLGSGTYNVVVKDAVGCTYDTTIIITSQNSSLRASGTATNATCGLKNGTINVSATTGTAPYLYSIDGGTTFLSTNVFTALTAGTYNVAVKDAGNCTDDTTIIINATGSAVRARGASTAASCAQNNGSITITAITGTAPFQYSIDGGSSFMTTGNFQNLAAGTYNVRMRDAAGCSFDTTISVNSAGSTLLASAGVVNEDCGKRNGAITATRIGGTGPSTYSLNNGPFISSNVFSNLTAGTYRVTIKDNAGCTDDTIVTVRSIVNAVTQSANLAGCNIVIYNGITYTSSTIKTDTLRTVANCDSVYKVANITVENTPPVTRTSTLNGCDSVVFNLKTYRSSTIVRDTVKTTIGCDSVYIVTSINVTNFVLSLTASSNPAFEGATVTLTSGSSTPHQTIAWAPAYLFPMQTASTQQVIADTSRMIKVIGESNTGCIDTAQLFLVMKEYNDFFIPNAFSPNADGKNDVFLAMGTTIGQGKVRIFNQWGGLVFSTDDIRKGWDGMYAGKQQPVGVYIYEVIATMRNGSEIKRKGFVNLIR